MSRAESTCRVVSLSSGELVEPGQPSFDSPLRGGSG